jgi:2-polyprenyl-3-methyl-5-hydroxy-6-metoxy-1,4-benzoquinol methylase
MGTLNEAALSLMISIGHRAGLFDFMTEQAPCTSEELAHRSGCNERYIREWLGAMVTGRVVDYDAETRKYSLPQEHAVFLARKFSPNNVALFAQYIPLLGSVEDDILHCFRNGGGVPYERYPRFHDVMAEDSGQSVLSSLFSHILPLVPGLTDRMERGIRTLDVGCGRGRALLLMAERFPQSEFHGVDLSEQAIAHGAAEASRLGLSNIKFTASDLSRFDHEAHPEAYDFVTTFDAVHDQAKPRAVLKGIHRTLKPEGVYLMQDINASSEVHQNMDHPIGTLLYTVSCLHCMTVSLAQDGEGLGAMWGREKAHELLREAGFSEVQVHRLAHDIQNEYYVIRK